VGHHQTQGRATRTKINEHGLGLPSEDVIEGGLNESKQVADLFDLSVRVSVGVSVAPHNAKRL
jgi:hypothetical protein